MIRPIRFAIVLTVLLPLTAAADEPVPVAAGAHVIRVLGPDQVVINRGEAEGLTTSAADLRFSPMRTPPGSRNAFPDLNTTLARGRVIALGEHEATVALEGAKGEVPVGSFVSYVQPTPTTLARSALYGVLARDIQFTRLGQTAPIITLAELWENDDDSFQNAILDAMTDEVRARSGMAARVHNGRIAKGTFAGLTLETAFKRTTRGDLRAFARFVASYPAKYMNNRWKLVEIYATWIVNGSPRG